MINFAAEQKNLVAEQSRCRSQGLKTSPLIWRTVAFCWKKAHPLYAIGLQESNQAMDKFVQSHEINATG